MTELYKPTEEELKTILENHRHWLRQDCEGWENMCANLSDAYLRGANLSGANLSDANLSGAYLRGANLSGANLSDANLSGAYLRGANLSDAYLRDAYLRGANLRGANLSGAYLRDAYLSGANLSGANLSDAYLSGANLSGANLSDAYLRGANLSDAYLRGANLSGANLSDANLSGAYLRDAYLSDANLSDANLSGAKGITMACPSDGAFTAWKKAWHDAGKIAIIKLQIPEDAKRSSATGRKCRADKAVVLAIFDITGDEIDSAYSDRDHAFVYRKGETVAPDAFDDNRWNECSNGIHFFITRQEAEEYEL